MRIYQLTLDRDDWYKYQIEGAHEWALPALRCPRCGSAWKSVGEAYPTVDVDAVLRDRSRSDKPLGLEDFRELRLHLRPHVPEGALLNPGATFGPLVGSVKGKLFDFAWHEKWTMLIQIEAAEQLKAAGVHLGRWAPPRLISNGEVPNLVEPEVVPLLNLAAESLAHPERDPCSACGRMMSGFKSPFVVEDQFPDGVDICRARNNPAVYLVSERFAEAVRSLGLTGYILKDLASA